MERFLHKQVLREHIIFIIFLLRNYLKLQFYRQKGKSKSIQEWGIVKYNRRLHWWINNCDYEIKWNIMF